MVRVFTIRSISDLRLAENRHGIARRLQRTLGGLLIRDCLLQILLRDALYRRQLLGALQCVCGQIQHPGRGNQCGIRLDQIGTLDGEQRLPALHVVAHHGEQLHDAALVRRKHLGGHVLVEIDVAHGLCLNGKRAFGHAVPILISPS
jgi:hypothetical protein